MASRALKTTAFLLTLNILFISLVSSTPTLSLVGSAPAPDASCPINCLRFNVCGDFLNNLLHGVVQGTTPPASPCCGLFIGLFDFNAATCLCRAIKANVLGVNIEASASLSLVLNSCGKQVPSDFQC